MGAAEPACRGDHHWSGEDLTVGRDHLEPALTAVGEVHDLLNTVTRADVCVQVAALVGEVGRDLTE
ncbi:hypothetical protein ACQPZP_04835 [Spirillospora sp. CA-142024]|uniref:hypothetical protein n=1 Tax=Spirillospora sp. CA-142024 TaxID=3240036 RepID=UPI003D89FB20